VLAGFRLPAPDNTPPEIADLMKKCWEETPDYRPQFSEIFAVIEKALLKYRDGKKKT
jgi:tyrosine-protein kinase Fer